APYFQAAEIFLFPSLYEGFGIPPLQAMACSTPTITANTTSLPEVVGKAGILLSPEKKSDWIKKIYEIENNSVLRKSITTEGLAQAKKFSWEKCAQETINTYKEVYDAKN
ncbi:MAG: glycosyltransferase, partial [Patescibacteria group bacterium]|nr:glycosyltransferase [Patescibacteria group bacterium]